MPVPSSPDASAAPPVQVTTVVRDRARRISPTRSPASRRGWERTSRTRGLGAHRDDQPSLPVSTVHTSGAADR